MAAMKFLVLFIMVLNFEVTGSNESNLINNVMYNTYLKNGICYFATRSPKDCRMPVERIYNRRQIFMLKTCISRYGKMRRSIVLWSKHGYLILAMKEGTVSIDITIYMDIESNPGPVIKEKSEWTLTKLTDESKHPMAKYYRSELFALRKKTLKPLSITIQMLKHLKLFKYRGSRAGQSGKREISSLFNRDNVSRSKNIDVIIGRRKAKRHKRNPEFIRPRQLVRIPRSVERKMACNAINVVPKFLCLNICSLVKTTNNIKATVALHADLCSNDIDIGIISETHLNQGIPDFGVHIPDYSLYRRDRDCFRNDMRKKGGVAVYIRNNIKVASVNQAELFEVISIKVELPSNHAMLICGIYHPPRPKYNEIDLIDYIQDITDDFLDENPNCVVVLGGDLNKLNIDSLAIKLGFDALVNFPTRGNNILDNFLTNCSSLFHSCYAMDSIVKTDHRGVVLPPINKIKPVRMKNEFRDHRQHRKLEFYKRIQSEDWSDILRKDDIDTAVIELNNTLLGMMDECMPLKSVKLSTRDPIWMTPLVKHLLKKKSRLTDGESRKTLNEKIGNLISKNRKNLRYVGNTGSSKWWKGIDKLSNRKYCPRSALDVETLNRLNDYFGNLCFDPNYNTIEPVGLNCGMVPQLTSFQVFKSLATIKKTAPGPDRIPYWVWRDYADEFTPVVLHLWNLSLRSQKWPVVGKEANIDPLPMIDIPLQDSDYRGINVTPVIARAFEKIVYKCFCKDTIESNLNNNQFAYRKGSSCVDALLSIQDTVYGHLDNKDIKAVRLFAMDFSKAFDWVNHTLLCDKLKNLPLHPVIINWYLSFLRDRKQRVFSNGIACNWKSVNRGTTQGSVSGPYLFNIFINDLTVEDDLLVKYADDSTVAVPVFIDKDDNSREVLQQFFNWTENNEMVCNPEKCHELVFRKKGNVEDYDIIMNIPQCNELTVLGMSFQSNCKFNKHVKNKLCKANKSLYVLRSLRKEGYNQNEIDYLFQALVMPNITYGLTVYGASNAELNSVQQFLDRCKRRGYTSKPIDVKLLLEEQDKRIFNKVRRSVNHPLYEFMPKISNTGHNLRTAHIPKPKINTIRYKNCFKNRLIFKHGLAI